MPSPLVHIPAALAPFALLPNQFQFALKTWQCVNDA